MKSDIKITMPRNHTGFLFGDSHEGLKAKATKQYRQAINDMANTNNAFAFHMGDLIEGRPTNHTYYDITNADPDTPLPVLQYKKAFEELRPLIEAGVLKGGHKGNHDNSIQKSFGPLLPQFCEDYGIIYCTYSSIVSVVDPAGKLMYKMFLTHGSKGMAGVRAGDPIQVRSNRQAKLKRVLRNKCADVNLMAMGHSHYLEVAPPMHDLYLYEQNGKLKQGYFQNAGSVRYIHPDHRWYVNTGSFLRTFVEGIDTYSEEAGYDPTELGYAGIDVIDGEIVNVRRIVV